MRPQSINDLVGQKRLKEVLNVLIKSAKLENKAVKHFLCSSPPGFGKTSVAYIIANEIQSNVFTINCSGIKQPNQILRIIENMANNDILFLEECHSLPQKVQEFLYTIMEDFRYFDDNGNKIRIPYITIIGATTNIGLLAKPMRDRFQYIATFEDYTEDELIEICLATCRAKGFTLSDDIAKIISKTCRGTPRIMVNRTEWIYNYMRANNLTSIKKSKIIEIIALQGINEDGLDSNDIQYLKLLSFKPMSIATISSKLSIDQDNIKTVIEPYLNKLGLIDIVNKGRKLTAKGNNYVNSLE
jgi:Holliday junction DNA helicase RuvB